VGDGEGKQAFADALRHLPGSHCCVGHGDSDWGADG